jgi:C-terminal processing protease CtpA/Prc
MKRLFIAASLLLASSLSLFAGDTRNVTRSRTGAAPGARRAYLGVTVMNLNSGLREHFAAPKDAGILVATVREDSPAAQAGIRVGDIITRVDGAKIDSAGDIHAALGDRKEGDRVQVEIVRDRVAKTLTATVDERQVRVLTLGDLHDLPQMIGNVENFKSLQEYLDSPAFKAQISKLDDCSATQSRLKELERRLDQLEKKSAKQ